MEWTEDPPGPDNTCDATQNMVLTFCIVCLYALVLIDDWDVYYERGRKPKESILKYEATRSEGDYRRKVLFARVMRDRGEGRGVRG